MTPEMRALREPVRKIWLEGFIAAFREIDSPGDGSPAIPITLRTTPSPDEVVVVHDEETRYGSLRALLRPIKPMLMKVVRAVTPLLLKVARRPK